MPVSFHALRTQEVVRIRTTGRECHGHAVERAVSGSHGVFCRC